MSAESVDCECGVEPDLDCSSREGLVGIACVGAPRCFDGWQWVSRFEVEWLRCQARDVFRTLAPRNGLTPLGAELSRPFVELGVLARRGLQISVVWMGRPVPSLEELCLGLRRRLGRDGLIVVTPALPRVAFPGAERIVFHELPAGCGGNFGLERALDELTPDYRSRVIENPLLDLDYVRLRFATRPGDRHVVEINGHDFGGFRKSDVKFLRMLLLATARKYGANDGWLDKSRLRDGDDKDRALERMREELITYDVPGLSEEERRALVRANKGQLRLGVPPENIELDPSLTFASNWPSSSTPASELMHFASNVACTRFLNFRSTLLVRRLMWAVPLAEVLAWSQYQHRSDRPRSSSLLAATPCRSTPRAVNLPG